MKENLVADWKKKIFNEVLGFDEIQSEKSKRIVMSNFDEFNNNFNIMISIYEDDIEVLKFIRLAYKDFVDCYETLKKNFIINFANDEFNCSIDMVLTHFEQENILLRLEKYCSTNGVSRNFQIDIYEYLKYLSDRLDKRFCFDDVALINLIEASSGKNIQREEGFYRKDAKGNNIYLKETNGKYTFSSSSDVHRYTHNNKQILNARSGKTNELKDIELQNFPLGVNFSLDSDKHQIMKKLMEILYENLSLCWDTYRKIYTDGSRVVDNTAHLSDGNTFSFKYYLTKYNIPHLLGIQRANIITNETARKFLGTVDMNGNLVPLNSKSSALQVFEALMINKNRIINSGGLYEENGKFYEILPWEKIIIKTASFMRGDFFKTCFCLAKLSDGNYMTIASTNYKVGLNARNTASSVLNDLLKTQKQKKDFVFRKFIYDDKGHIVPNSIFTAKSENIRVGKNNELLKTLQKWRNLFDVDASGIATDISSINELNEDDLQAIIDSIVESIENENFRRTFTKEEQLSLGVDISRELKTTPYISEESLDLAQTISDYNDSITLEELEDFINVRGNKKKR